MVLYTIGVLAIFKDERVNLQEWVEHYLWQGASCMYMIDNGSTDDPLEVLRPYIKRGLVKYFERPKPFSQIEHYREIYSVVKEECEWCLIADLDEFWYTTSSNLLSNVKKESDDVIYSDWVIFGSSGLIQHPPSIRMSFCYRWNSSEATQQKYFFRTKCVRPFQINVHYCMLVGRMRTRKDNQLYVVNHYAIQSLEYFTKFKMQRGDVLSEKNPRNLSYFHAYDRLCTVQDVRLKELLCSVVK